MHIKLLTHTPHPLDILYSAYRSCYSEDTPADIFTATDDLPEPHHLLRFIEERMKTEHTSPLEQVSFTFSIAGISRALSHQLVRHRVGVSIAQQSQRYVVQDDSFDVVFPPRLDEERRRLFQEAYDLSLQFYERLMARGVPAEDARFVLPQAVATNIQMTINYAALLHMADIRLCMRTQWEFRQLVAKLRHEVMEAVPALGRYLQPKCGPGRQGFCDEDYGAYQNCPLSKARPHKFDELQRAKHLPNSDGMIDWSEIERGAAV